MASLSLDYACIGFNPSQYVVIAYVADIAPWEYREYHFSVDNPDVVFNCSENDSKFIFYLKYNEVVNVTCTVNLFTYDINGVKNIYYTLSKTVTIESFDNGSSFNPILKLNREETTFIPSYASFSIDITNGGIPPFEYFWDVISDKSYTYHAEQDRLFLIAMENGRYIITCTVLDAGGMSTLDNQNMYVKVHQKHIVATQGQNVFNISDIYANDNIIHLDVYHNGLYMLEGLDYLIDSTNKTIVFNFGCRQNDIITVCEFYKNNNYDILAVNSKYFVSTGNQTVFNISDIYNSNVFNITVFRNGLLQVEDLDYVFNFDTHSIIFKYPCPNNNVLVVSNFVRMNPNYGYLGSNNKTIVSELGQYQFDISDIYRQDIFHVMVYRNGLLQVYDLDYIIDNEQIRFLYPCNLNDIISIVTFYQPSRMLEYVLDINSQPMKEDVSNIYKREYNIFKGKLTVPYNINDDDKDAILAEINLLSSYDMRHILLFIRDKASNSNFFDAIDNIDSIYSNIKYRLCATAFDSNNYLYFYVKCASDYSAKTAAARLFEAVSWVMHKHGYGPVDNKIVYTYEYEPVLYSEQVVNDLTAYLEHAMQTRYNRMDLLDVHEALKREVGIFLESIKNTDPVIMDGLQKI